MEEEKININIIDNVIQAISILNKLDEYVEGLVNRLSICDSLVSDFEHFIENTPIEEVNLKKLYQKMQDNFKERRIIKDDIIIKETYKTQIARLNNSNNREFLVQNLKNTQQRIGLKYKNRILTQEEVQELKNKEDILPQIRKRGRPKKEVATE